MNQLFLLFRFLGGNCGAFFLLLLALVLNGCSRDTWHAPLVLPADSLALMPRLQAKKITITGPVNFITQLGTGHSATTTATDNTKAGQKHGTAATGAGSTATSTPPGAPWWVYALVAAAGAAGWVWLRRVIPFPA